jgi:hypothetical protein
MAYSNVTVSGPANVSTGRSRKVLIQVNKALTGTIVVSDETATAGTPVIGTITNPTVGLQFEYWDMKNGVTVNPSVATDVTVSVSSGMGGNQ